MQVEFKTNLKCGACVAKVEAALNALIGVGKWRVDLSHVERTLVIEEESLDVNRVSAVLSELGYRAELKS